MDPVSRTNKLNDMELISIKIKIKVSLIHIYLIKNLSHILTTLFKFVTLFIKYYQPFISLIEC